MNKLSILTVHVVLSLSIFSCNPYKKIASDVKRTPGETKLLSTICAQEFPVIDFLSEGSTTIDSTKYVEAYKALSNAYRDASNDVQNLINRLEQEGQNSDVLRSMLFDAQKKADSLKAVKSAYLTIPCPETHIRDTMYREATAKLASLRIDYEKVQRESALKDIKIDKANSLVQDADQKLKNQKAKQLKQIGISAIAGAVVTFLVLLFLKLKKIL